MMKLIGKTIVLVLAVQASAALALGLGEITVNSAINQKFVAEITLTKSGNLDKSQILVSIAAEEDFQRAGVERPFYLNGLRFEVVSNGIGEKLLKVTSNDVMLEPYMNFVLELMWPHGRVLKEYLVLLDLPALTTAPGREYQTPSIPEETTAGASTAASNRGSAARPSAPRSSSRRGSQSAAYVPPVSVDEVSSGQYRVQENQSLWNIAKVAKADAESVTQAMDRIFQDNPQAFVNNDINRLKKGVTLTLGTATAVASDAETVLQQAAAVDTASVGGTSIANLESKNINAKNAASEYATSTNIVPGGTTTSADIAKLEQELARSFENLDKTSIENVQLEQRIENIQDKFQDLEQLIELKDKELTELKDNLTGTADGVNVDDTPAASSTFSSGVSVSADSEITDESAIAEKSTTEGSSVESVTATLASVDSANSAIETSPSTSSLWIKIAAAVFVAIAAIVLWLRRSAKNDDDSVAYEENIFAPIDPITPERDADIYQPVDLAAQLPEESLADDAAHEHTEEATLNNDETLISTAEERVAVSDSATNEQNEDSSADADVFDDLTLDFSAASAESVDVPPVDEPASDDLQDLRLDLDLDADINHAAASDSTDGLQLAYDADALEGIASKDSQQAELSPATGQDFADEVGTKLDLARAYIDMGDIDGAREILDEVLQEGSVDQKDQASEMISRIA